MVRYYGFYNNKCHDTLDEINKLLKYSEEENLAADEIAERIENLGI